MKLHKQYTFTNSSFGQQRYPWDEWAADSKVREFEKGVDFTAKPGSFAMQARKAAKRLNKLVRIAVKDDSVVIQFEDKPKPAK